MILPSALTPQSLQILQGIRLAFRDLGNGIAAEPNRAGFFVQGARDRLGSLLKGVPASLGTGDPLAYPVRAARRFAGGEAYSPARFRALENHLLKREGYLQGYSDALSSEFLEGTPDTLGQGEGTLPSPPVTMSVSRPPSFEDCVDRIERAAEFETSLPEELRFLDLSRGDLRMIREKNRSLAGKTVDLSMQTVLKRIFSRTFDIGANQGNVPGFWAEKVILAPSLPEPDKPSVRISCHLASADHLRAFVIAVQALLNIPDPIEIELEGRFEWRDGALYIPMKPVRLSGGLIPADTLFGTVTPILVPISEHRTVLGLDLEDKILSQHPEVFVEAMDRGIK